MVPLPLIFRPDFDTDGFWSLIVGATSGIFLEKVGVKIKNQQVSGNFPNV